MFSIEIVSTFHIRKRLLYEYQVRYQTRLVKSQLSLYYGIIKYWFTSFEFKEQGHELEVIFKCTNGIHRCSRMILECMSGKALTVRGSVFIPFLSEN